MISATTDAKEFIPTLLRVDFLDETTGKVGVSQDYNGVSAHFFSTLFASLARGVREGEKEEQSPGPFSSSWLPGLASDGLSGGLLVAKMPFADRDYVS